MFKTQLEFSKMLNTIQLMEPLEDRQKTLLQKDFFSFVDDGNFRAKTGVYFTSREKLTPEMRVT